MRTFLLASAALLVTPFATHAIPTPVNPLGEHGTSAALSLQGIINARGNTLVNIHSDADQLDDLMDSSWSALGAIGASMVIEVAGYAPNNAFGIYNAAKPWEMTQVFGGAATGGAATTVASPYDTFGFYLQNANVGFTWYSDSSLNVGGLDHMVAYQGKGETLNLGGAAGSTLWGPNSYLLGWEDLNLGDWDYNDMVVMVSNVRPSSVPDGGSTVALVGLAMGMMVTFRRFKR